MSIDEAKLLTAMRGAREVDDVCRTTGISRAEFAQECDAWLRSRAAPRDVTLRGAVRGPVEILRDRAGVPHIYASHTDDVFFGLGFAMAQDRLWQIDRLRRRDGMTEEEARARILEAVGHALAASA